MHTFIARALPLTLAVTLAACGGDSNNSGGKKAATPDSIELSYVSRYSSGEFLVSAAEITAYHPASQRAFVTNALNGAVDVLDMSNLAAPSYLDTLRVDDIVAGAVVNSVAVWGNLMAFAVEAPIKTDLGFVAVYNATTLERIDYAQVGAQPDMLTFTPDGRYILVANEGEPNDDYSIDPEGSVSIVNVSDLAVRTAGFQSFNADIDDLRAAGVRIFGPNATVAKDLEPEYIAVSADSKTAWVSLQENNALAKVDITTAKVTDIFPLGYKDHGVAGNGIDASDTDGEPNIDLFPGIVGMYQPDSIASFDVDGQTYIVTANEGDARAWGEDNQDYWDGDASKGFVEEFRFKHLFRTNGWAGRAGDDLPPQLSAMGTGAWLNPTVFDWCGATAGGVGTCRDDDVLGRLTITWTMGYQTNPDGSPVMYDASGVQDDDGTWLMYDTVYAFGARSVSIWDEDGNLVWDSGDQMEQYLASDECMAGSARNIPCKDYFNSNHSAGNSIDNRSDNKGPEPEGVAVGVLGEKTYAFVGLERMGGVMVYDVTDPANSFFVDYLNTRENWVDSPGTVLATVGDLGIEGITFIAADDSPNGEALLLIGNEVSGTTSVFQINQMFDL
jgi:DNA-binding beta-propeller fold protein YncE